MESPGEDVVVRSIEPVVEGGPSSATACPNCGSDRVDNYCARCGQRAGNIHTPVGAFLREALDGLFSFDSRVWRTLIALLRRPGHLTREYWLGRRARFVAPLRLYLFVSFLSFLFLAVVSPERIIDATGESSGAMVRFGITEGDSDDEASAFDRWLSQRVLRPALESPERTQAYFVQRLPWVFFFLMPLFAALLRLLYRRRERFFVPHLVFALHFHAAALLLYSGGVAANALSGTELGTSVAWLAVLLLLFLSLRHVYEEGLVRTAAKQAALLFVHVLAIAMGSFALLVITGLTA